MGFHSLKPALPSKIVCFLQMVFVMCWMSILADTDSIHVVYSFCGIASILAMYDLHRSGATESRRFSIPCGLMAVVFSFVVCLANYAVFQQVRDPVMVSAATNKMQNLLNLGFCMIGGFCVAYPILMAFLVKFPLLLSSEEERKHPGKLFWFAFGSIVLIDLVYLLLDEFPGHVTPDSLDQIIQGYEGTYINNHPYWHTYWIKLVLSAGYGLLGSTNGAVALFSVLQILLVAACFAYALVTMYQAGMPKWCIALAYGIYSFLPYNIAMSITMWKDVPFAFGCLIFVLSLYRILKGMNRRTWTGYALFALGAMGMCLLRTNGMPSLMLSMLVFVPCLWKKNKAVLAVLAIVLVVCILLTGPVLDALGVVKTDFTEALSIPLQQFARVIAKGYPLTAEEADLLGRIFDLEEIPELYTCWLSDPIKLEVRENDIGYFRDNIGTYGKLWVQMLLKYPGEFVEAWVEQTKGYWNGGYDYHQYAEMVQENSFGIAKTSGGNIVAKLIYLYFGMTRHTILVQPLLSIGLHVWILVVCCFACWKQKRQEFLLPIPVLCTIASLFISTPVFSEFRYAYAVFLLCPVILPITMYRSKE